ncbi:MAG TPA: hypothetical protein VKU02_06320 [Gemmataceae bacterium]|nr:hypothetical protein [Gemmataceae bacterium]
MFSSSKRMGRVAVLGLIASAMIPLQANAQRPNPNYQVRPGLTLQQAAFNIATIGQALSHVPPYALGYNPYARVASYPVVNPVVAPSAPAAYANPYASLYANPYATMYASPYANAYSSSPGYDTSSYSNPYMYNYYDPYGGYLRGAADVINAQGRFLVNTQQAYLTREQVRSERLANRRKVFDEYLYEREKTPTPEEERQRNQLEQLNRSRNNPPVTEIWSGKALNDLLADLRRLPPSKPESGQLVNIQQLPLDEDGLKHINVSKGAGNIALLKNEGKLTWPVALNGPDFKEQRERVNSLAQAAVRQAEFNGQVDPGTLTQLSNDVDNLQRQLRKNGGDLPFALYTEAKTFLNNLDDAVSGLRQRDVGNYFTGKFGIKAKTIPELVDHMTKQGLQFASAMPGDESAYSALHQALANYDVAAHAQTANKQ